MCKLPPRSALLPFVTVLKCTRSPKRPTEYQGQWPRRNRSYITDVFTPPNSDEARVYVRGLLANAPHDSFPIWGWAHVATIWLN